MHSGDEHDGGALRGRQTEGAHVRPQRWTEPAWLRGRVHPVRSDQRQVQLERPDSLRAATPEVEMLRAALTSSASGTLSGSLRSFGPLRGKRARGSHLPGSSSGGLSRDGSDSHGSAPQSPPCVYLPPVGSRCVHAALLRPEQASLMASTESVATTAAPSSADQRAWLHHRELALCARHSHALLALARTTHSRCRVACRSLDGGYAPPLATLHESDEDGARFDDYEAAADLPDVPVATFDGTQLRETNTWSQTQPHETQGITGETVAVLDALRQMEGPGGDGGAAAAAPLSFAACTAGLDRREAAKFFYQLLGAILAPLVGGVASELAWRGALAAFGLIFCVPAL